MRVMGSASRSLPGRLLLLAPSTDCVPDTFKHVEVDAERHAHVLGHLQRLRGSIYLQDGAITPNQLRSDGRHALEIDRSSWHLVSVQPDGRVTGCARYCVHEADVTPETLGVWKSSLARHDFWQSKLWMAVEEEIDRARRENIAYVEVGGWAIADDFRYTAEAFELALSAYALAENTGGCIGITTATVRHCSSRILRKIGGRSLEIGGWLLPSYFDPQYKCEMEVLRFDSRTPSPRYAAHIQRISRRFLDLPILCARVADVAWSNVLPLHVRPAMSPLLEDQACA